MFRRRGLPPRLLPSTIGTRMVAHCGSHSKPGSSAPTHPDIEGTPEQGMRDQTERLILPPRRKISSGKFGSRTAGRGDAAAVSAARLWWRRQLSRREHWGPGRNLHPASRCAVMRQVTQSQRLARINARRPEGGGLRAPNVPAGLTEQPARNWEGFRMLHHRMAFRLWADITSKSPASRRFPSGKPLNSASSRVA